MTISWRSGSTLSTHLGSNEYAGVSVLAPKQAADREPCPAPYTHAHDFLWIPGKVSAADFHPIIERHIDHVEGATPELHPLNESVSVWVHQSDDVETPDSVRERGSNLDRERGDTTSLPQELGNNLPLLDARFDARGLSEYAERWCAHMRLGIDGKTDTRGIRRFRPMKNGRHASRFSELADEVRHRRRLSKAVRQATILNGQLGTGGYGPPASHRRFHGSGSAILSVET